MNSSDWAAYIDNLFGAFSFGLLYGFLLGAFIIVVKIATLNK